MASQRMSRFQLKPLQELLVRLESGARPRGGVSTISEGVPSIGGEHLNKEGSFDFEGIKFVPEQFFQQMARGVITRDDILVVKDGATTGKTAFVGTNFPYDRAAINEHVFMLRVNRKLVLPRFVFFFLFSPWGQSQILASFRGAAVGGISQDFAQTVEVPLPSLSEQERIVGILDEVEALRRLRVQVDQRTEVLIPAVFVAMFGSAEAEKSGLPCKTLGEVCTHVSGATPSTENPDFWSGGIPWVSPKDMKSREIHDATDRVSDSAMRAFRLRLLPKDTVLIVIRGMILAHTFPVAISRVPLTINQDMKGLIPNAELMSDFLHWCLHMLAPKILSTVSTAGHGTKRIEMDTLLKLPIPIPRLEEQRAFADRIKEIHALEAAQSANRSRLDDLFQSLLQAAFAGEL